MRSLLSFQSFFAKSAYIDYAVVNDATGSIQRDLLSIPQDRQRFFHTDDHGDIKVDA